MLGKISLTPFVLIYSFLGFIHSFSRRPKATRHMKILQAKSEIIKTAVKYQHHSIKEQIAHPGLALKCSKK